ncbi:hypothetical protein Rxycam_00592 [Rubrobacter xylanophilus DSM 9941]|nr:hypothetical protein Rxycam_00592 [Rubrobacter xylanophilus DSM 9941]
MSYGLKITEAEARNYWRAFFGTWDPEAIIG